MITLNYSTTLKHPGKNYGEYYGIIIPIVNGQPLLWKDLMLKAPGKKVLKYLFLPPDKGGMFGIIEKKIPNTEMSFRHQGEIKDGVEEIEELGKCYRTILSF